MKWTKEQKQAVDASGNTLVNASAGSGKTAVLTQKVAGMLADGSADAAHIMVLTFTREAAGEMRDRIALALKERLNVLESVSGMEEQKSRIEKQLQKLGSAAIQTFHSFCFALDKQYSYRTGIGPRARIIPELTASVLKSKACRKILDQFAASDARSSYQLVQYFGNVEKLTAAIKKLHSEIYSYCAPLEWMQREENEFYAGQPKMVARMFRQDVEEIRKLWGMMLESTRNDSNTFLPENGLPGKVVKTVRWLLDEIDKNSDLDPARLRIPSLEGRLIYTKDEKNCGDDIKECIKKICSLLRPYVSYADLEAEQKRRAEALAPVVHALFSVIQAYDEEYARIKKEEGYVEFADMERMALTLLQDPLIQQECQEKYDFIFVDEYQDTNPTQEQLISLITRGDNLYCVGDMKQSIYRFRSADPSIFSRRRQAYTLSPENGQVINLTTNFRSAKNILDCANDVFTVLEKSSREMSYGDEDALRFGRQNGQQDADVELYVLGGDGQTAWFNSGSKVRSSAYLESLQIARLIEDLMKTEIWTAKEGLRPCRYSDIAVLARKRTGYQESLIPVLKSRGIPFALDESGKLMDAQEIQVFSSILMLADNYNNDIGLITLFHNRFFGLNDEDLVTLQKKRGDKESLIHAALRSIEGSSEFAAKMRIVSTFIEELRRRTSFVSLTGALTYARQALEFDDFCIALGDGRQRIANVEVFIRKAGEIQIDGSHRMYDLAEALREDETASDRMHAAQVLSEGDCVKLMTIHKSKGLQFPVVIMPFLDVAMKEKPTVGGYVISEQDGLGLKYRSRDENVEDDTAGRVYLSNSKKAGAVEEEMRLLYVGMTRAEERLCLVGSTLGSFSDIDKKTSLSDDTFMNWLFNKTLKAAGNGVYMIDPLLKGRWSVKNIEKDVLDLETPMVKDAPALSPEAYDVRHCYENMLEAQEMPIRIPSLVSATHLTREEELFSLQRPAQSELVETESIHKGNAFHKIMERMDLSRAEEEGYIEGLMKEHLDKEAREMLSADLIRRLLSTGAGQTIRGADSLVREKRLQTIVPYSLCNPEYTGARHTTMICVLDMLFEKEGKWYLVDWKTDAFQAAPSEPSFERELHSKAGRHKRQMALYERAVRECCGIQVEDTWLGFADTGLFYSLHQNTRLN